MVLDHVTQRARAIVIAAAVLYADLFGDCNLDVIDVATVPDWLEEGIGEAEGQDVLDSLLTEIMVDAVNLAFLECLEQGTIEGAGKIQVAPKGFFYNQARTLAVVGEMGQTQIVGNGLHNRGRGSKVKYTLSMISPGFIQPV